MQETSHFDDVLDVVACHPERNVTNDGGENDRVEVNVVVTR